MIKIIHIRSRWIKLVFFIALGLVAWAIWRVESPVALHRPVISEEEIHPPEPVLALAQTPHGPIALNRAVICLDVHEGKPLLIKSVYDRRVDYLFCYTVLTAAKGPVAVVHRWKKGDQVIFEKRMTVFGKGVPVWSRRQLYEKQSADWRVEIITEGGIVLGFVPFKLW